MPRKRQRRFQIGGKSRNTSDKAATAAPPTHETQATTVTECAPVIDAPTCTEAIPLMDAPIHVAPISEDTAAGTNIDAPEAPYIL